MSDLVRRLRAEVTENKRYEVTGTLALEAADRIEQLEAALEPLACTCDRQNGAACSRSEVDCPFWNARAALEEK